MKAITIKQPYARLIVLGEKTIEVRSKPIKHRGRLAIHAGLSTQHDDWTSDLQSTQGLTFGECVKGAIIGSVDVVDCRPLDVFDGFEAMINDGALLGKLEIQGLYAWVLANASQCVAVPHKGFQNLFEAKVELVEVETVLPTEEYKAQDRQALETHMKKWPKKVLERYQATRIK